MLRSFRSLPDQPRDYWAPACDQEAHGKSCPWWWQRLRRWPFPSENYLKGALWIGRNLTLVVEELADSLDIYRNKHLIEIAGAVQDSDPRRSSHRLNLLAAAGITECLSLANTSRMRARNILQGAASILPGDNHALKGFVNTLPIEAPWQGPGPGQGALEPPPAKAVSRLGGIAPPPSMTH